MMSMSAVRNQTEAKIMNLIAPEREALLVD